MRCNLQRRTRYPILRRRFVFDNFCHRAQLLVEDLFGVVLGPLSAEGGVQSGSHVSWRVHCQRIA